MNQKYQNLYKKIIKAYYDGRFEDEFESYLAEFDNKEEAKRILLALCDIEEFEESDDSRFVNKIIQQVTSNQVREKIVLKLEKCHGECKTIDCKGKCQSVCPFDAIQEDAISGDKIINENLCMSCGRCVNVCPMENYLDIPQALPLMELLKNHAHVIAIIAPAITGQFGKDVSLDQLREAFIKIGFEDMVEVAMGADVLTLKEAMEYNCMVNEKGDFMITSCCCPVWIAVIKKYYDQLVPEISPSVSPMVAMARIIKKLNSDMKVVFIGPCIAKKAEAKEKDISDAVDYVLTFQEVQLIFEAFDIDPSGLQGVPTIDYASRGGRLYARAGGVTEAVWNAIDELCPEKRELFTSAKADGVEDCKKILNDLLEGKVRASFIEGMGCKGGCVGGPKRILPVEEGRDCVNKEAADAAIKMPSHSEIIINMLDEIGIHSLEELRDDHTLFERHFTK